MPILATTHSDIPEVTVLGRSALLSPERDIDRLRGTSISFSAADR
jgi:hypothetical protein